MTNQPGGGSVPSEGSDRGQSGNVSHDPNRMTEESKKRMQQDYKGSRNPQPESEKSPRGGNFTDTPEKGGDAGRKGGQPSPGSSPGSSPK
jgi:general stress protein YciG